MSSLDRDQVLDALAGVIDPLIGRPISELGMVDDVKVKRRGSVHVSLLVPTPNYPATDELRDMVESAIRSLAPDVGIGIDVAVMSDAGRHDLGELLKAATPVTDRRSRTRIIGIASGKGGVGKSSVSSNLAVELAARGHKVGLVDADVWGFSIPKMLGVARDPIVVHQMIVPPIAHGVKVMSMDYFVGEEKAVIWRGPMLHKAMEQFLQEVAWDAPDFLLIDMPPGTGDISISLSQFLPRAQVLVVTTPQPTAQRVAKRAALMAEKVDQEIIGVVENMSWFTGDDGKRYAIFGEGGGARLAEELGVDLLARIPLDPAAREAADAGIPVRVGLPDSEVAAAYAQLADEVERRRPRVRTHPELVVS